MVQTAHMEGLRTIVHRPQAGRFSELMPLLPVMMESRDGRYQIISIQLREHPGSYNAVFDSENEDIGLENGYYWNINS